MSEKKYDAILERLDQRYRAKKLVSRTISRIIFVLGVTSFVYGWRLEPSWTIFRFMTVDGTVFTTCSAFGCAIINRIEIMKKTELTKDSAYYLRLSSAVAESVIFIVVVFSQLPIFSEHLQIFDRYDSFVMHILIPILCIVSFLINDASVGKLSYWQRWHGTRFVTCYAMVMIWLIGSQRISTELIPYYFLDFRTNGWGIFLLAIVFVYAVAYLMSWCISEGNRKLTWVWFTSIARKEG